MKKPADWHSDPQHHYRLGRLDVLRADAIRAWREYVRFLRTMRKNGEVPDPNKDNRP